jgi:hypothetical protein
MKQCFIPLGLLRLDCPCGLRDGKRVAWPAEHRVPALRVERFPSASDRCVFGWANGPTIDHIPVEGATGTVHPATAAVSSLGLLYDKKR